MVQFDSAIGQGFLIAFSLRPRTWLLMGNIEPLLHDEVVFGSSSGVSHTSTC